MNKIIEFKPKKKKAPVRRNARRGLSIIDKFKEINKQWHENEKKFMPYWNDFKGPERKYWKEAFRIYRAQNKLLRLNSDNKIKKVVMCSGKIYYDLIEAREKFKNNNE